MDSKSEFGQLWEESLAAYRQSTGRTIEEEQRFTKLQTIDDLFNQIAQQQAGFSEYRGKHSKFFECTKQCLQPVAMLLSVTQSAMGATPFAPAATIFGAFAYLIQAAKGVSEAYDWIETLLDSLSGFMQRLDAYLSVPLDSQLKKHLVSILACLLSILGNSENTIRSGRFRSYKVALFLGKDEKIKADLDRLDRLFRDESLLVQAHSYRSLGTIKRRASLILENSRSSADMSQRVHRDVEKIASSMNNLEAAKDLSAKNLLITVYLKEPTEAADREASRLYEEYRETAVERSGNWLLQEVAFQQWLDCTGSSLLFISGSPGTGKSFLSALTISVLAKSPAKNELEPTPTVVYFYVKSGNEDLQNPHIILKTLAYKLVKADPAFRHHAIEIFLTGQECLTAGATWNHLILPYFQRQGEMATKPAIVIVDGLDEAPRASARILIQLFQSLARLDEHLLRIIMFGRPELSQHIDEPQPNGFVTISIGDKNLDDIRAFVTREVRKIRILPQIKRTKSAKAAKQLAREILNGVCAHSDGMFFKAALILNEIYEKPRKPAIMNAIQNTPPGLNAMIAKVFQKIFDDPAIERDDVVEVLTWVAFAKRAPTVAELHAAVELRAGQACDLLESQLRNKLSSVLVLRNKYGKDGNTQEQGKQGNKSETSMNSIEMDEFDFDFDTNEEDDEAESTDKAFTGVQTESLRPNIVQKYQETEVRFTHGSIRDYLVCVEGLTSPASTGLDIVISANEAHLHILSTCLDSITTSKVPLPGEPLQPSCSLLQYAAEYWMDHLSAIDCTKLSEGQVHQIARKLCRVFVTPDGSRKFVYAGEHAGNKLFFAWLVDSYFVDAFQKLVQHIASLNFDDLNDEERTWISAASESKTELWRPIAVSSHRLLMTTEAEDDYIFKPHRFCVYLVWIVHSYLTFVSLYRVYHNQAKSVRNNHPQNTARSSSKARIGGLTAGKAPSYNLSHLMAIVNFQQLHEGHYWHTMCGMVLLLGHKYDEAIIHYTRATKLNNKAWKAYAGLATCHSCCQRYNEAQIHTNQAIAALPEQMASQKRDLQSDTVEHALAVGNLEKAEILALGLYKESPKDLRGFESYIKCLYALKRFSTIRDLVSKHVNSVRDILNIRNRRGHLEMTVALRETGDTKIMEKFIFPGCLDSRDYFQAPWVFAHLAETRYHLCQPDSLDDARILFEYILSPEFRESLPVQWQEAYGYPSSSAKDHLSHIYFQNAMKAMKSGYDYGGWLAKLDKLDELAAGGDGYPEFYVYASLIAAYFRRTALAEEELSWRPYISSYITKILDSKAQNEHPRTALEELSHALFVAGDKVNAVAAIAPVFLEHESGSTQRGSVPGLLLASGWKCNGYCSTIFHRYRWKKYQEMYLCTVCFQVAFCEDCYPLLKSGKICHNICFANHEHVQVFPVPAEARGIAAEFGEDSRLMINNEWVERLRIQWRKGDDIMRISEASSTKT